MFTFLFNNQLSKYEHAEKFHMPSAKEIMGDHHF